MQGTILNRISTGIPVLDNAVRGGVPSPSEILLFGDIGTGKSVICQQFLYKQSKVGYKTVYFSIDNPPENVISNMDCFGWYDRSNENIEICDLFTGDKEICLKDYIEILKQRIMKNDCFIIDSFSTITMNFGEEKAYKLFQIIHGWVRNIKGIGIINAVRKAHSPGFETAIKQISANVVEIETRKDGKFLKVVKTARTSHLSREFQVEVGNNGIKLI